MIRTFGRFIIATLIGVLFAPVVFFGYSVIFVCEIISRIIYKESVADTIDVKALNKRLDDLLNDVVFYIVHG